MKKALLCGLVCVFALTTVAQADVSLSWTITSDAGMDKVVGTLTTTGGLIDALDLGNEGAPGITGTLYQQALFGGAFNTPALDVMGNASPDVDTHFLFSSGDLTVPAGRELAEDNDKSIDGAAAKGWGTYLGGTFGLSPSIQATSIEFVQLYLPTGQAASYSFEVSEAGVGKALLQGTTGVIPEPSMMVLLGLGSVVMLLIRRR